MIRKFWHVGALILFVGTCLVVAYTREPTPAKAFVGDIAIEEMAMYGISSANASLMRYDFSNDTLHDIATVSNAAGEALLGIEASAYVPGNLNIFGFWPDPSDGFTKVVYINTKTGLATPVGQHLGTNLITGAVALKTGSPAKWYSYAVQHLEDGVVGGHFDVDTSTTTGKTNAHIHEYDDEHNVLGIDAFNYLNDKLLEINEVIPEGALFRLITVNADLSPGAMVRVNGETDNLSDAAYTLGDTPTATTLVGLAVGFAKNTIAGGGLVPTETGLVRANTPGPNGEHRNGAFTVQAVALNADGSPAYTLGANGAATSGLLWETTLFWHVKLGESMDDIYANNIAPSTGRLIRVNHITGEYETVMELERSYDSLAASGGGGTAFLATSGFDLYSIDVVAGTETHIGSLATKTSAMEYAAMTLMSATSDTTELWIINVTEAGGSLGLHINMGMSNLGSVIFVPLAMEPQSDGYD